MLILAPEQACFELHLLSVDAYLPHRKAVQTSLIRAPLTVTSRTKACFTPDSSPFTKRVVFHVLT